MCWSEVLAIGCFRRVGEFFAGECLEGKNPEGDEPPAEAEDDAEVDDAAPRLVAVFDGPDESGYSDGEDVGFDFCFPVGVEIPHAEEGC